MILAGGTHDRGLNLGLYLRGEEKSRRRGKKGRELVNHLFTQVMEKEIGPPSIPRK